MKNLFFYFLIISALVLTTSCEKEHIVTDRRPVNQSEQLRTLGRGIGDLSDLPNDNRVQYPTIIHRTYIPSNPNFSHTKCKAWRIIWPEYNASVNDNKIATVFSINNGALNSFHYLNSVDPATTHNAHFSLYFDKMLISANTMWAQLNHVDIAIMETTYFAKTDYSVETIEGWVKERPSLFKSYWPGSIANDVDYNEGDIFLFRNANQDLYGGIRIVSMAPRIIEVYLAVPNI